MLKIINGSKEYYNCTNLPMVHTLGHFHWSFIEKTSVEQSMRCKVCSNLANQVADQLADLPPGMQSIMGKMFFLADLHPHKIPNANFV